MEGTDIARIMNQEDSLIINIMNGLERSKGAGAEARKEEVAKVKT